MPTAIEVAVDTFIRAWSEPDPATRATMIEACFAADGRFVTRSQVIVGHAALAAEMTRVRADPNLLRVRLVSAIDARGSTFRYRGVADLRDGKSLEAFDAGEVDASGKISLLLTFPGPLASATPALPTSLSLTLVATSAKMAAAFASRFRGHANAAVVESKWEALPPHDCFVTAGNAFGLMSAGIDAAVVHELGDKIQEAVQLHILNQYLGEQPIGTAFVLATGNARVPFLCHAPTMRVPGDISRTENVYLATRAALLAIHHYNRTDSASIRSVVMPAFGAGFGQMAPDEVARQMAAAWRLFLEAPYPPNWDRVLARERLIAGERKPSADRGDT